MSKWFPHDDPWDPEKGEFGVLADYFRLETGVPLQEAENNVVSQYLKNGDLRALRSFLLADKAPNKVLLRHLATSLDRESAENMGFQDYLVSKRVSGTGRRNDISKVWRDQLIYWYIDGYISKLGVGSYDSAIEFVRTKVLDNALKYNTIRKIYDKQKNHGK